MEQQIRLDLTQTQPYVCKHCKSEVFIQVCFIRIVPALLSPSMHRELVPIPAFQCTKCRTLVDMNPKEPDKAQK